MGRKRKIKPLGPPPVQVNEGVPDDSFVVAPTVGEPVVVTNIGESVEVTPDGFRQNGEPVMPEILVGSGNDVRPVTEADVAEARAVGLVWPDPEPLTKEAVTEMCGPLIETSGQLIETTESTNVVPPPPVCGTCNWRGQDMLCRRFPPNVIQLIGSGSLKNPAAFTFPARAEDDLACGEWKARA
jgi:hypothetical protein